MPASCTAPRRSASSRISRGAGVETAYETVPTAALIDADAAWLLSSVRLAAPIAAVDGVAKAVDRALTDELNTYLLSPRD